MPVIPLRLRHCHQLFSSLALASVLLAPHAAWPQSDGPTIDFNRDIRPILSDACFQCHGPDAAQRQADLQLHTRDGLYRTLDGVTVITPGNLNDSELFQRIMSEDPDEQMPPPDSGRRLSVRQRELIQEWITQGARWKQHWAFVPPLRPAVPAIQAADGQIRNPIDSFVQAALSRQKLTPAASADRRTMLRRVTLDLTGLPPTPQAVTAFLADSSPDAYESIVDRLLKSPRSAERLAARWLDSARYADTSGYQSDGPRYMWRWRDWVIQAYLDNKPFDEFTIEQLAGDLLPEPTLDQRIATAFNRNHRGNAEGGIVPEEFQVEYVVDRVDTTFTVWQGLTAGCARCHSHKYDPISQREYYQLFAYFNNIPENGRALKEGNSPPWIPAPTPDQKKQLAQLQDRIRSARNRFDSLQAATGQSAMQKWMQGDWKEKQSGSLDAWPVTSGLVLHLPLDQNRERPVPADDTQPHPDAARAEPSDMPGVTSFEGSVATAPGRYGKAIRLSGDGFVEAGNLAAFGYFDEFSVGALIYLPEIHEGTIVSKMEPVNQGSGYNLHVTDSGTLQVNFVKRWLDDSLRVETQTTLPVGRWTHILMTYDGTRTADAIRVYVDAEPVRLKVNLDGINQSFASTQPVRIGAGNSHFHGLIDDVRIYSRVLRPHEVIQLGVTESIRQLLAVRPQSASRQRSKLESYFHQVAGPVALRNAWQELEQAEVDQKAFLKTIPTVMVMHEMETPRTTHILTRGQYDRPAEAVTPGVPAALPPLPHDARPDRLSLARWLVSTDNPLTARVTVNRMWRDLFGTGLVKTTEDFGSQGQRPRHPELLDWLAVEFMDSGWNVRHLLKTIVMSHTYRQSSRTSRDLFELDPDNRMLARGPRFRLPAEVIRDQALFVSGLLTEKLGGPSVKPYQPAGLWSAIASDKEYVTSSGSDLYRRSLYTYWKRTVAPPMMSNFDASGREMCEVRLTRTNTPLQALNLLNDVTFVEASRSLAERVLLAGGSKSEQLDRAFLLTISRKPMPSESELLLRSQSTYQRYYQMHPGQAASFLDHGQSPRNPTLKPHVLAAWTAICSTILNLDETVTKE